MASCSDQIILKIAKAIGAQLEMPQVLAALNSTLEPIVHFDAITIATLDGEFVRRHYVHIEGVSQEPGESVESVVARYASDLKLETPAPKIPVRDHPIRIILKSREPYVLSDVTKVRSSFGQLLLKHGFRSYVGLPLINKGEIIGVLDFVSKAKGRYTDDQVRLLQEISEIVAIAVANALAYQEIKALKEQLQVENRILQDEIVQRSIYEEIVGSSESLQRVVSAIERVAPTDSTILITGETGTGKELVAHAIHRRSGRSARALVKVNFAALPAELIASELFGHEKGAYTGAMQQRIGRFEAANGGTLFLDEVGELSPEMQVALLRILQEKEFERVGGNRTIQTDVRVIAATNSDLERAIADGRFRTDLYYRLNVFPIHLPPLRERVNDIPVLVDYFAGRLASRMGKRISQVEKQSLEVMQQYSWPGNIRELQNVIERCVILADGEVLRLEPGMLLRDNQPAPPSLPEPPTDRRTEIESILRQTRGRVYGPDGAAARLGVPASTLESRIRSLKINKHQFK